MIGHCGPARLGPGPGAVTALAFPSAPGCTFLLVWAVQLELLSLGVESAAQTCSACCQALAAGRGRAGDPSQPVVKLDSEVDQICCVNLNGKVESGA